GVTEEPSNIILYDPSRVNDYVGALGATKVDDGLRLRQSNDKGGLVLFLKDNEYEEWSFSFTISEIDLHFPEQAGVYMWYTKYDQDMGTYRGGDGHFDGLMAGIEFKGMSPEIVYAMNNGEDLNEYEDHTIHRDSFDPLRLKDVKELTVKVILTHKNFKVELYNQDKLLYDSFRYIDDHPFKTLDKFKRFSITSFYSNTSAEKAFILKRAQLYKRTESEKYDAERVHAIHEASLPMYEHEVHHPNKELRMFIAQFTHFIQYAKGVLGSVESPLITTKAKEIIDKIEETNSASFRQTISSKINDIELRIQQVDKNIKDLLHHIKEVDHSTKISTTSYIILGFGVFLTLVFGIKEYQRYAVTKKNL
ncbi:Threonyl-tRNA synthetase, partial [Nosema bombycis CQ1]